MLNSTDIENLAKYGKLDLKPNEIGHFVKELNDMTRFTQTIEELSLENENFSEEENDVFFKEELLVKPLKPQNKCSGCACSGNCCGF